ncbi:MAG: energy transducer TonB [Congregibacter sp.]
MPKNPMVVIASAQVKPSGLIERFIVMANPSSEYRPFERATTKGLKKGYLSPAAVDGRRRGVWINFSVAFAADDDARTISIYPHMFTKTPGSKYAVSAPQRMTRGCFPGICRTFLNQMWVAVDVDRNGHPSNGRVVSGVWRELCRDEILDIMLKSSYLPAMRDGVPVAATFYEAWNN